MWLWILGVALYTAGVVGTANVLREDADNEWSPAMCFALALFWPLIPPLLGLWQMLGQDEDLNALDEREEP